MIGMLLCQECSRHGRWYFPEVFAGIVTHNSIQLRWALVTYQEFLDEVSTQRTETKCFEEPSAVKWTVFVADMEFQFPAPGMKVTSMADLLSWIKAMTNAMAWWYVRLVEKSNNRRHRFVQEYVEHQASFFSNVICNSTVLSYLDIDREFHESTEHVHIYYNANLVWCTMGMLGCKSANMHARRCTRHYPSWLYCFPYSIIVPFRLTVPPIVADRTY